MFYFYGLYYSVFCICLCAIMNGYCSCIITTAVILYALILNCNISFLWLLDPSMNIKELVSKPSFGYIHMYSTLGTAFATVNASLYLITIYYHYKYTK